MPKWLKRFLVAIEVLLFVAIMLGYLFKWDWTGFIAGYSKVTIEKSGKETTIITELPQGKSLWDVLNLLGVLAIPAMVGFGTIWFTAQQGKVSNAENTDNQRETALQSYINAMSELLLTEGLRTSQPDDEVQDVARVRTLTVLQRLDEERKVTVLRFLRESGLIQRAKTIIDLKEADLSHINLSRLNLEHTNLSGAKLRGAKLTSVSLIGASFRYTNLIDADLAWANLSNANLNNANLNYADLSGANLNNADLTDADLYHANLYNADLSNANLSNADLNSARLIGAKVTQAQLKQARSLEGATMPDGSKHT